MPKKRTSLSDAIGSMPVFDGGQEAEHLPPATPAAQAASPPSTLPAVAMTDPRVIDFDFSTMPEDVKAEIKSLQKVIVTKLTSVIVSVGEDLLRMKVLIEQHCERGTWSKFLAQGLLIKESSARNYMRAAEAKARFTNSATVAEMISPTALYRAHSAPEEVMREIEQRIEKGETVTGEDVDELVRAYAEPQPATAPPAVFSNGSDKADPVAVTRPHNDHPFAPEHDHMPERELPSAASESASSAAAIELIALLRHHYDQTEIIKLNELWQAAGSSAVRQHLAHRSA